MTTRFHCPRCGGDIEVGQRFCGECRLALDPASVNAFLAEKRAQEAQQQLHQLNVQMMSLRQQIAALQQSAPSPQRDQALQQAHNQLYYLDNQYRNIYYSLYPPQNPQTPR